MKTDQERIDALAAKIRDFKIIVSGGGNINGGFGQLPKDGPITMEHLEDSFRNFRISGQGGIGVHGSLKNGYSLYSDFTNSGDFEVS